MECEFTFEVPTKEPPDRGGTIGKEDQVPTPVSFRDKLLRKQSLAPRPKVDLLDSKAVQLELVNGSRLLPMFRVDKKLIEELSIPWKDALIIKLLGKSLGYNVLKSRLSSVWKILDTNFDIMDVGNGFFMVKFDVVEDRTMVMNGGPWMIFDHYLSIRLWTPEFNANLAVIDKTLVWVRIPNLNTLFFDESFILAIASSIGKPIKVDLHTLCAAKGRFARVCVEIDLNQSVVGKVGINDQWYNVEYEGLHILCAHCGCYGHLSKTCPIQLTSTTLADVSGKDGGTETQTYEGEGIIQGKGSVENQSPLANKDCINGIDTLHGNWLLVQRKKKGNKSPNNGGANFRGLTAQKVATGGQFMNQAMIGKDSFLSLKTQGDPSPQIAQQEAKNWTKKRPRREGPIQSKITTMKGKGKEKKNASQIKESPLIPKPKVGPSGSLNGVGPTQSPNSLASFAVGTSGKDNRSCSTEERAISDNMVLSEMRKMQEDILRKSAAGIPVDILACQYPRRENVEIPKGEEVNLSKPPDPTISSLNMEMDNQNRVENNLNTHPTRLIGERKPHPVDLLDGAASQGDVSKDMQH